MIAKANLHAHGQKLAAYLITGKMGERAELVELRGFASSNIREAFLDVQIQSEATRCEKPFFHCYVRLPDGEGLAREQWQHIADRIEKQLGFEGQGRAVAFHHDRAGLETHMHMAWSRIDLDDMRAIDPGLYKNKLKEVSRQLERELGLTRLSSERDPNHKTLAPGRDEFEQSRRLGTDIRAIREDIRDCWERSDSGKSFIAALAERGHILARGDRRDFVVVDPAGGDHALGKRITGATAAETRTRLADIDKARLPSVEEAKAAQAERASNTARESGRHPQLAGVALDASTAPKTAESRTGPANEPAVDRGIPSYPAARNNAPAFAPARQIVARAPETARKAERSAPARAEAREATPARPAPEPARAAPKEAARDAGVRKPADMLSRLAGGLLDGLGRLASFAEGLFSPPSPPTPDQAERIERAAYEEEAKAPAREAAREQAARHEQIVEQSRQQQRNEQDRYSRYRGALTRGPEDGRERGDPGRER